MKNKFYRIISPVALLVTIVLDIAVIWFAIFAVRKLMVDINIYSSLFAIIEIFAIAVAFFVSKEIVTQGIVFKEDSMEFTALDDDNVFLYSNIKKVETQKDKKASLVKNFNDRQSRIILYFDDERTVTVDIGLTTSKTLKKIEKEINSRIKNE